MVVVSTREVMQNQKKFFEMAQSERVIVRRKNHFYQLLDLGESIPELDDTLMSKEEFFAKIDEGIAEYKAGKTKKLRVEDINSFLGI
ncbi:MAG: prevent-host-death protein [Dysgonamonadaceae bacterium]|nr:prevent-host-death protein [Dysgonamonadaceae bacterium]